MIVIVAGVGILGSDQDRASLPVMGDVKNLLTIGGFSYLI